MRSSIFSVFSVLAFVLLFAPIPGVAQSDGSLHKHEHHPPHGGTPVMLGDEIYHLEFLLDPAIGQLSAYVLDGEMEDFIRSAAPSFEIVVTLGKEKCPLLLHAVANSATGETVGDRSFFETSAEWLKPAKDFDALLTKLEVRGTTFTNIAFNFP